MNNEIKPEYKLLRKEWRECAECGEPAVYHITFLLDNARRNPDSNGYGKDDISWCSDEETWACEEHKTELERTHQHGLNWCATFGLDRFKHMGEYWVKDNADVGAALRFKAEVEPALREFVTAQRILEEARPEFSDEQWKAVTGGFNALSAALASLDAEQQPEKKKPHE